MEQKAAEGNSTIIDCNKSGISESSSYRFGNSRVFLNGDAVLKSCTVSTGKFQRIGGWYVINFLRTFGHTMLELLLKLNQRCCAFIYGTICITLLTAYLGFCVWYWVDYEPENTASISTVILATFCFLYIACLSVRIWFLAKAWKEHDYFSKTFVGIKFGFTIMSLYVFTLRVMFYHDTTGIVFLFAVFAAELAHFVVFLVYCTLAPFILLGLFVEFIIRAAICNLACATEKEVTETHQYAVFKSANLIVAKISQCGLCNRSFNRSIYDLCITKCVPEHVFHERCIIEHFKKDRSCPVCGTDINFKVA